YGDYGGIDYSRYIEINGDLTDRDFVNEILAIHRPDVIIHLASQPSMPYSQINGERALYTQVTNISMLINLLWGAKENGLFPKFITTTTTGIPGQHYAVIEEAQTLNCAGSWYHVSRGFDSANLRLAGLQFGFTCVEFRTSIVYGLQTELLRKLGIATRFDTDYYFGTAFNRFIKMGMEGKPLTVYGKGLQTKPFISLEDTVHSLVNSIDYIFPAGHTILNQTTSSIAIVDLANMIATMTSGQVKHIDNPRKENEEFMMEFKNEKFLDVLAKEPTDMKSEVKKMVDYLKRSYSFTTTCDTTNSQELNAKQDKS
ncbi:hypothetical protein LCGC14_2811360, partial [marine sediment metagenome]